MLNSLVVPPEVIQNDEEKSFVWIQDSQGQSKQQFVQIGLESLQGVEIKSGLHSGSKIVIPSPERTLMPGMPLQIDTSS